MQADAKEACCAPSFNPLIPVCPRMKQNHRLVNYNDSHALHVTCLETFNPFTLRSYLSMITLQAA